MTILTINTGSSSVRLVAFVRNGDTLKELAGVRHDLSGREPRIMLKEFMQTHGLKEISVVAHRVVHGGATLIASRRLDQEVEREIEHLAPLAPLHNPVALHWIRSAREVLAGVAQVAVFDTAFFAALPEPARTYAIPHALAERHGLRRYGFHGLAHQAMWRSWRESQSGGPRGERGSRVISMQLGAGCSITAVEDGLARDTSMGFSPLEGLMMATRSGDIDPGLITFLQRQENLVPEQVDQLLNQRSGLLGVSGISGDMHELLKSDDERARLAVDSYCYRVRKYIGAYLAVLGGAEAIVFGGGVGENVPAVREKILAGMQWCGVEIDPEKNFGSNGTSLISSQTSRVEVWVIPVNEAIILAREADVVMAEENKN
ncbi:acetate/propionate family kinase [Nitrosovibrio sp. Nv6]|uniref:acetate/propionate family kinase n=1 Tax=Nitrosovibrio sp. Nv6 TaxID=1855340 RepID=UPI0008C1E5CC|nr:acetate/propionate family kinase [Nitrosovibrio sp. Nv6]SEP17644.1 acetate kinase [Nitrosovibrio sp. Nv6]